MVVNNGIKTIKLSFGTYCDFQLGLNPASCELIYQNTYKPVISALYNLPELPFSLSFSGTFLEWIEHHHPEFFMIISEMTARKQLEIIGGGYYSPLFPLIPPIDRVGQIELLTTSIRKNFSRRPRGAWIESSAWEPSMISSFNSCGIEFVLLDKLMLETADYPGVNGLKPVTIEDSGKTIIAIPLDNSYRYLERFSVSSFIDSLSSTDDQDICVTIFIARESLPSLFISDSKSASSWFESFLNKMTETDFKIELTLPGKIIKTKERYHRAYLATGMSPYDYDRINSPDDTRILCRTSIKYLLLESPSIMFLYSKMMYVHILVNQLRGDKARKKTAREELWLAQNALMYRSENNSYVTEHDARKLRIIAYKSLLIAEKLSRLRGVFCPSLISIDFDMDGIKEYLCQYETHNLYVHAQGGYIFEFDVFSVYRNYCDLNLPRAGLFIDHLLPSEEIKLLEKAKLPTFTPVFSQDMYQELSVDNARQEITLKANVFYGSFQQPLSLKKTFSFRNEGIQVQYILKNESPLNLSGIFMIELDLGVAGINPDQPIIEVFAHDERIEKINTQTHITDMEWIHFDDPNADSRFTFDANENPSVLIVPVPSIFGVRIFLYWKVELGPNFETEKMVFMKIKT